MNESRANDATQEASNICADCGGLDNTIHLCDSNRLNDPTTSQRLVERQLKRKKKKLSDILKKVRDARKETHSHIHYVSEGERILKLRI
jgi:hypothetical protein